MIKLTEKSRKLLRIIYGGLGLTAVSLAFQTCPMYGIDYPMYGMPYPDYGVPPNYREDILIKGSVVNENSEAIPGIGIWIKDITVHSLYFTKNDGEFYFYVPKQDAYTIVFSDIDGIENGGLYKPHTVTLAQSEAEALANKPLIVTLTKVDS